MLIFYFVIYSIRISLYQFELTINNQNSFNELIESVFISLNSSNSKASEPWIETKKFQVLLLI